MSRKVENLMKNVKRSLTTNRVAKETSCEKRLVCKRINIEDRQHERVINHDEIAR